LTEQDAKNEQSPFYSRFVPARIACASILVASALAAV
jgi:hypothetical protein